MSTAIPNGTAVTVLLPSRGRGRNRVEARRVSGTIIGSILVGVRHPGYIYQVETTEGTTNLPTAMIEVVA